MKKRHFVIGFSGNRPMDREGRLPEQIDAMRLEIERAFYQMREEFAAPEQLPCLCCSAAEGADTVACEIAISLGWMLDLVLPKPPRSFREDFEASLPKVWERVSAVLAYAASGANGSRIRVANTLREPECYEQANRMIFDVADAFVILWDGVPTGLKGGAGAMVDAVNLSGLPCVLLNTLERR